MLHRKIDLPGSASFSPPLTPPSQDRPSALTGISSGQCSKVLAHGPSKVYSKNRGGGGDPVAQLFGLSWSGRPALAFDVF